MKRTLWAALIALFIGLGINIAFEPMQAQGPLTNALNLPLRAVNGSLQIYGVVGGAQGPLTTLGNMLLRSYSGALAVSLTGGTATPDKICLDATNQDACIWRSTTKTLQFDADGASGQLTGINYNATTNTFLGDIVIPTNRKYFTSTRSATSSSADGLFQIQQNAGTHQVEVNIGTAAPTLASCGTGTITTHSTNAAGEVTNTGAVSCILTFASPAFTNQPFCVAIDETSNQALRISAISTTSFTLVNLVSGDKWMYHCLGGI